jgi:hypothetical protein
VIRRAVWLVSAALVLAALVLVAPVVSLALDEGAVPSSSDIPPLPDGVTLAREESRCGSGGCYHWLTLDGPEGQSAEQLAASVGAPHETCHARSLLDRRQVCSGVVDVIDERVVLYVRFDRSFSL